MDDAEVPDRPRGVRGHGSAASPTGTVGELLSGAEEGKYCDGHQECADASQPLCTPYEETFCMVARVDRNYLQGRSGSHRRRLKERIRQAF